MTATGALMRAVEITQPGGPDVLVARDVPMPVAGAVKELVKDGRRIKTTNPPDGTGKGGRPDDDAPFTMDYGRRGVLKAAVPRWLKEAALASLIAVTMAAHRKHGGTGALYIYLRKPPRA